MASLERKKARTKLRADGTTPTSDATVDEKPPSQQLRRSRRNKTVTKPHKNGAVSQTSEEAPSENLAQKATLKTSSKPESITKEKGAKRKVAAFQKSEEVPLEKIPKKAPSNASSKTKKSDVKNDEKVKTKASVKTDDIAQSKIKTEGGEISSKGGRGRKTKKIKSEQVESDSGTKARKIKCELKEETERVESDSSGGKLRKIKCEPKEEASIEGSIEIKKEVDDTMAAVRQGVVKMGTCTGTKFVGAHMSIAGGLHKAVEGAVKIGAKSFAMFLRSQRQWAAKPLDHKIADKFRQACKDHNFSPWHIVPHGSYLLNSGSPNPETLQKTRDTLTDELKRCEELGLALYNFHPGSTCGEISVEECLDKIGDTINLVHKQTNTVMTVIENMSCQGNTVGGKFEELRGIIDRVDDKSRIGVCLDTCHAFAAGFDLASESGYESMMTTFDKIVGLEYLKAVHLNDSKGKVASHLDRHENIGKGHIGLKAFNRLMNDPRFDDIPIVLETPAEDDATYEKEIHLLYSMQDAKN